MSIEPNGDFHVLFVLHAYRFCIGIYLSEQHGKNALQ